MSDSGGHDHHRRAKKASLDGLVFITERGKIADLLAMPELADIELEIPPRLERARSVDLS